MEKEFLSFVSSIMEEEVSMDTRYKEGNWDSLMMLTLVMELEEKYDRKISMESLRSVTNMSDLFQLVKVD